jgi:outer membrane autotransporter protein
MTRSFAHGDDEEKSKNNQNIRSNLMNNKNLKKFLTVSMLAGLTGIGAMEAIAAVTDITADAILSTGAGIGGAWTNTSPLKELKMTAGGFNISSNLVGGAQIGAIDLAGVDSSAKTLTVTTNTSVGSIVTNGAGLSDATKGIKVVVNDSQTLTLTGTASTNSGAAQQNNYGGVKSVVLGSANASAATVNITATNATFGNTFNSDGAAKLGIMNIKNTGNIFNADIGATNALAQFNISGDAATTTFGTNGKALKATAINVGDGTANKNYELVLKGTQVTGNIIGNASAGKTAKITVNANDVTIDGNISDSGNNATSINFATDHTLTLNKAGGATIAVPMTVDTDGWGTVKLTHAGDTIVSSSIGTMGLTQANLDAGTWGNSKFLHAVSVGEAAAHKYSFTGKSIGSWFSFTAGVHDDTVLELGAAGGQYVLAGINTGTASTGIISVVDDVWVFGDIGDGNAIKNITFGGKTLSVGKIDNSGATITAQGITFADSNDKLVFFNNETAVVSAPVTVSTKGVGSIKAQYDKPTWDGSALGMTSAGRFTDQLQLDAAIGALAGNALGLIDAQDGETFFSEDAHIVTINAKEVSLETIGKTLKVDTIQHLDTSGNDQGDALVTYSDDAMLIANTVRGDVTFSSGNANVSNVGTVTRDVFVDVTHADKTIVKNIGSNLTFTADGNISIADGGSVTGIIRASTLGHGTVKTLGSATLRGDITGINGLNLAGGAANKIVTISTDSIGGSVTQDASTLAITQPNTVITVTYNGTGSTLNVGSNNLIVQGASTLAGAMVINANYDGSNGYNAVDFSNNGATPTVVAGLTGVRLNITSTAFPDDGTEVQFLKTAITLGANTTAFQNLLTATDTLATVNWTKSTTNAGALIFNIDRTKLVGTGLTMAQAENKASGSVTLTGLVKGKATKEFDYMLASLTGDKSRFAEALARLDTIPSKVDAAAQISGDVASLGLEQTIDAGIDIQQNQTLERVISTNGGVAAGDGVENMGVWAKAIGGMATQKERKGSAGFKSKSMGVIVGADTVLNDRLSIGFTVGNNMTGVKHKNTLSGDKTKTSSWIFGLYGNYHIADNWFVRGAGIVAQTAVDHKSNRVVSVANNGIARSKYDVTSVGISAVAGYNFFLKEDSIVTPTLGVKWHHTNDIEYQETGNTKQNNKVTQKGNDKVSVIGDIRVAMGVEMENGTKLMPFAHVGGEYGLGSKTPKGTFSNEGIPGQVNRYVGTKPAKLSTAIGVGVDAKTDMLEYGVAYNANIANKYLGHEGSVRVEVKF